MLRSQRIIGEVIMAAFADLTFQNYMKIGIILNRKKKITNHIKVSVDDVYMYLFLFFV